MGLNFYFKQNLLTNLADNELASNLPRVLILSNSFTTLLFYGLLLALAPTFILVLNTQVDKYTNQDLWKATHIALDSFIWGQDKTQATMAPIIA